MKHHFIAFVLNANSQLVELDGVKVGPNVVKEGCTNLLKDAVQELLKRLEAGKISESLSVMTLSKKPQDG